VAWADAWCVIVFTIYGDQMDLFGVGHKSWDDREAYVAYVALLRKYCQRFISLDLLSSFSYEKKFVIVFQFYLHRFTSSHLLRWSLAFELPLNLSTALNRRVTLMHSRLGLVTS
jgi:hypothetical protein